MGILDQILGPSGGMVPFFNATPTPGFKKLGLKAKAPARLNRGGVRSGKQWAPFGTIVPVPSRGHYGGR